MQWVLQNTNSNSRDNITVIVCRFFWIVPLDEQKKAERAQGGRDTPSGRAVPRTKLQDLSTDKDRELSEELPRLVYNGKLKYSHMQTFSLIKLNTESKLFILMHNF